MDKFKVTISKVGEGYQATVSYGGFFSKKKLVGKVTKSPATAITSALRGYDFKSDN